jgi:hypothetical protein
MKRWILMSLTLLTLALNLMACSNQGGGEGEAANPPPTTNPMGEQPAAPDTPGAPPKSAKRAATKPTTRGDLCCNRSPAPLIMLLGIILL